MVCWCVWWCGGVMVCWCVGVLVCILKESRERKTPKKEWKVAVPLGTFLDLIRPVMEVAVPLRTTVHLTRPVHSIADLLLKTHVPGGKTARLEIKWQVSSHRPLFACISCLYHHNPQIHLGSQTLCTLTFSTTMSQQKWKIAFGCDEAGVDYKNALLKDFQKDARVDSVVDVG